MSKAAPGMDYDALESSLNLLAKANRLQLLSILRSPRTLDEIRLAPSDSQARGSPDRPISRQAVQYHLRQLVEAGVVRVRDSSAPGKRAQREYVLDHARLFSIIEDLRKLTNLQATEQLSPDETLAVEGQRSQQWDKGAKLVLVHGVREGKAFPLRQPDLRDRRGWIIGRKASCHVGLEFDPYVSSEHAEVLPSRKGFRLLDLRTSLNRTYLNWEQLATGAEASLESGDIIGVGRSLLVFRDQ